MAAVGPRRVGDGARRRDHDARLRLPPRELEEVDTPVRARDGKYAVGVLDVADRCLELLRRQVLRFRHSALGSDAHGRSADEERARAGAAEALRAIGVTLHDADLFDRHAEHVDRELRIRGREPLTHRLRRRDDLDSAVAFDSDRHGLREHVGAGPFEERGHAASAQPTAAFGVVKTRVEPGPVGKLERLVHHGGEPAAVVGLVQRILVGHLFRPDHVAPPKLDLIDPCHASRRVHQALDHVDRLRAPRSAVRPRRRGIGEHGLDANVDGADVVDRCRDPGSDQQLDDDPASGGVSADIGEGMHAQREDTAIRVKRELCGARHVAAVRCRQEFVHARSAPLDWTLQLARTKRGDDVFGIEIRLHPETAADVTDDDAHRVFRNPEHGLGQFVAQSRRRLATHGERQAPGGRVVAREGGARLDRAWRDALVDEIEPHDVGGLAECRRGRFCIAMPQLARNIAGCFLPDQRRAWHYGARQIHDHRQRLVADLDRLDGILRLRRTGGDHRGDRFADVPHNVDGERMSRRCRCRRAVGTAEIGRQRQRIHAGAHEILAGDNREHAGQCSRGRSWE